MASTLWCIAWATRNYRSKDGFLFGGHGKDGTLFKFYNAFLSELKSHLAIARQLMVAHLTFMRGGAPAIAPGTVSEKEHNIVIGNAAAAPYRLLEYNKNVRAKDYTKIPIKTKPKPKSAAPAFVIAQSKTEHVFYLDQVAKPDDDGRSTRISRRRLQRSWRWESCHILLSSNGSPRRYRAHPSRLFTLSMPGWWSILIARRGRTRRGLSTR